MWLFCSKPWNPEPSLHGQCTGRWRHLAPWSHIIRKGDPGNQKSEGKGCFKNPYFSHLWLQVLLNCLGPPSSAATNTPTHQVQKWAKSSGVCSLSLQSGMVNEQGTHTHLTQKYSLSPCVLRNNSSRYIDIDTHWCLLWQHNCDLIHSVWLIWTCACHIFHWKGYDEMKTIPFLARGGQWPPKRTAIPNRIVRFRRHAFWHFVWILVWESAEQISTFICAQRILDQLFLKVKFQANSLSYRLFAFRKKKNAILAFRQCDPLQVANNHFSLTNTTCCWSKCTNLPQKFRPLRKLHQPEHRHALHCSVFCRELAPTSKYIVARPTATCSYEL